MGCATIVGVMITKNAAIKASFSFIRVYLNMISSLFEYVSGLKALRVLRFILFMMTDNIVSPYFQNDDNLLP
jgi:hypothetical protein